MHRYLALDQSTSATKGLLFDERAGVVDKESRGHAQHYPRSGWVEHDAEEIRAIPSGFSALCSSGIPNRSPAWPRSA